MSTFGTRAVGNAFSLKWVIRGVAGLIIINIFLQTGFFLPGPILSSTGRHDAVCTPFDPVAAPFSLHLLGSAFNFTPATPMATPDALFHGKGIVIAASGAIARQAAGAYVTALVLRTVLHEDLPIEIFYSGPEEVFQGPVLKALEAFPDVRLLDLESALSNLHARGLRTLEPLPSLQALRGYAAKAYAMQACSFQEALLFDAGAIPFVPASRFFGLPSYHRHGLAVFSDYVSIDTAQWRYILQGMCLDVRQVARALNGRELDSSCVVMDKRRNADALAVSLALNGPCQALTYATLWGDKDTWALAMFYVGKTVSVRECEPGYLLKARPSGEGGGGRGGEGGAEGGARGDTDTSSSPLQVARKVNGHVQFLKDKSSQSPPGLVPLHHNNQLLDLRNYHRHKNGIYMDVFSQLGDVLMPGTRRRDCRAFPARDLLPLSPVMHAAYEAVALGLEENKIDHCVCRDDWISCEADIARLRHKYWVLRLIDWWAPREAEGGVRE